MTGSLFTRVRIYLINQLIQMQLSKKTKTFLSILFFFSEIYIKFSTFRKKKMKIITYLFMKLETAKDVVN